MDFFTFAEKIERKDAKQFIKDITDIVLDADSFVIFLQQKQLSEGKNNDNEVIGRYKPLTQRIASNPREYGTTKPIRTKTKGEPYNFEWTGTFYKGMYITVDLQGTYSIIIDSNDSKSNELEKKYKKLFGLIKKNEETLFEYLECEIIKYINDVQLQ